MATRNQVPRADGEGLVGTTSKRWGGVNAINLNGRDISTDQAQIDTNKANISTANSAITTLQGQITTLQHAVGSPLTAITVAGMTDNTKIYVYTGSETGYTAGNWYYYDGTDWVSGGVYNATAFETDKTLTVSGAAADAKVVGAKIGKKVDGNGKYIDIKSENLIADDNVIEGYYLNIYNQTVQSDEFGYTDYIDVENCKYLTWEGQGDRDLLVAYYADKSVKSHGTISEYLGESPTKSLADVCYIRLNILLSRRYLVGIYKVDNKQMLDSNQIYGLTHKKIILGSSNNAQFSTLYSAIEYAKNVVSDYQHVDILIEEGEYNAFSGINLMSQSSDFIGLIIPNNINLIGLGSYSNTIIYAELPADSSAYPFRQDHVSTINCWTNNNFKNLTIKSKNMRYPFHNDADDSECIDNTVEHFENVKFLAIREDSAVDSSSYAFGSGACKGRNTYFKNCIFETDGNVLYTINIHNRFNQKLPCMWDFESCNFIGSERSIFLTSYGSGQNDIVNLRGCKIPYTIRFKRGNTATSDVSEIFLYGFGNITNGYSYDGIIPNQGEVEMMI